MLSQMIFFELILYVIWISSSSVIGHNFTDLPSNVMIDKIFNHLPVNQQFSNLTLLNHQFYQKYFELYHQNDIQLINQLLNIVDSTSYSNIIN